MQQVYSSTLVAQKVLCCYNLNTLSHAPSLTSLAFDAPVLKIELMHVSALFLCFILPVKFE